MTFPDMSDAFTEWGDAVQFTLITKQVNDHRIVEGEELVTFDMLIVPMKPQQVQNKPEGQRAWRWNTGISDHKLKQDDKVKDDEGILYRVMGINNFKIAGFYVYDLTEDFQ